jgi:NAD(P)-dependent dehydrogenase (short-subunit alcohol dehydrogenase family)
MSNLTNKVVIVTGGYGLIGKAILADIKKAGAISINAEINVTDDLDNGILECDITDSLSVAATCSKVIEKYGRIDGLVNSAYPRTKDWGVKFEKIPEGSWKQNVDMQLNSLFVICQAALRQMKIQKSGSIVNISSVYGVVGPDFGVYNGTDMTMPAAYAAIKGGVINFSRYLASYYGPDNVRVNCVSPGGILNGQNERFITQYESRVPMRRMGLPEDIAPAVRFLLSDDAGYITGHNLMVDGGWTTI